MQTTTQSETKNSKSTNSSTPSPINNEPVFAHPSTFTNFDSGKHEKFLKAINTKNPLSLPTLEEQGASVQAKLIRLNANPEYQKLSTRGRILVRAKLYDDYVKPAYEKAGVKPPDQKAWLLGTTKAQIENIAPEDYFESKSIQAAHDAIASGLKTGSKILMAGAAIARSEFNAQSGLAQWFTNKMDPEWSGYLKEDQELMNKTLDRFSGSLGLAANATNFYLENHPRKGFLASAPSWIGEQVALLPLYAAINPVTEAGATVIGSGAKAIAPAVEQAVTGVMTGVKTATPYFTQQLLESPIGRFVGRRLIDATTGFLGSKGTGDTNKEAVGNAASFAAFGAVAEGLGAGLNKLKPKETPMTEYASEEDYKNYSAQVIAMGGRPFADAIHAQATVEMEQDLVLANPEQRKLLTAGTAEKTLSKRAEVEQHDPIKHNLIAAEKKSLRSMAKDHFGKPWDNLSKNQRDVLRQKRAQIIAETESELPSRVPDLNKKEVESNIEKQIASSPHFAAVAADFDKAFPEYNRVEIVNQQQVEANQILTGIKDPMRDAEVIAKARTDAKTFDFFQPIQHLNLRYNYQDNGFSLTFKDPKDKAAFIISQDLWDQKTGTRKTLKPAYYESMKALKAAYPEKTEAELVDFGKALREHIKQKAKENINSGEELIIESQPLAGEQKTSPKNKKLTTERFAQHRVDTAAYFKNPYTSRKAERLAADGTRIGNRDKRTWNERLKAQNFEQFIETLKEADGDRIHFESPYHRMLFHWSNRNSLPTPVRDKLLREMKQYQERQKIPRFMGVKDFNEEADWNLVHLTKLAQSGRLTEEGNVFFSTKTSGQHVMSPWQKELDTELEQQEYQFLQKTLELYPEQKKLLESTMEVLQLGRASAKTPKDWLDYNAAINNHLKLGGIN
jgi:hypothetical protein